MLNFLKYDNINAKIHCNISGLHLKNKGVLLKHFVALLNTLDSENCPKYQNNGGNKTVTTEVSEDSVVTNNEIDGFTKVGFCIKVDYELILWPS